jgi:ABC-2 type transport system permease protein
VTKPQLTTTHKLFVRRGRDFIGKQYRALNAIIDWIVMLYIGIPGILLFARVYYSLWREDLPTWLLQMPYSTVPLVMMGLIYFGGGLILYLEAADVLFLRQQQRWIKGVMLRGVVSSIVYQGILFGVGIAVMLPLLQRVYGMDISAVLSLYFATLSVKCIQIFLENVIGIMLKGWKRAVVLYLATAFIAAGFVAWVMNGTMYFGVILLLCIMITIVLGWFRFRMKGRFEAEVLEDERQKTKLTGILLLGAVDRPTAIRSRPILFQHSNALFPSRSPEMRVTELVVKSFLRGKDTAGYVIFTLLGFVGVQLPPSPVNIFVFILLLFLLCYWLNSYRRYFFSRELMKILPLGTDMEYRTAVPTLRIMLFPAVLCMSAGMWLSLYPFGWGILLSIPCALLITWWLGAAPWKAFLKRKF